MDEKSSDGRFEIHCHTRGDDSYMYSNTCYEWFVLSSEFGDDFASFGGREFEDSSGSSRSGTDTVRFDGKFVVARNYDGSEQRLELPSRLELADGGRALLLTWADGRSEKRGREAALGTMGSGAIFRVKDLVGEPPESIPKSLEVHPRVSKLGAKRPEPLAGKSTKPKNRSAPKRKGSR